MGKSPSFQFYPNDWIRDLSPHPNEIGGAWMMICSYLWWERKKGQATKNLSEWSRILGEKRSKTFQILSYLQSKNIATVEPKTIENNPVFMITVISRRMVRDHNNREKERIKKQKQRENIPNMSPSCPDNVPPGVPPMSPRSSSSSSSSSKTLSLTSSSSLKDIRNDKAEKKSKAELLELDLNSKNNSGERPESSSQPEYPPPPSQDQRPESSSKSKEAVETENPLVRQFFEIVRKYPQELRLRESEDSQWFQDRILKESQFKNLDIRDELDGWGSWLEHQHRKKKDQLGRKLKKGEKKHTFPESDFKRSLVNRLKKSVKFAQKNQNQENSEKSKELFEIEKRQLFEVLDHARDTSTEQFSITQEQYDILSGLLEKAETPEQLKEWNKQFIAAEAEKQ